MAYTLDLADLGITDSTIDLADALSDPGVVATVAEIAAHAAGTGAPEYYMRGWRRVILSAIMEAMYPSDEFDVATFQETVRTAETE